MYTDELTPNQLRLYEQLTTVPPDFERLQQELASGCYTKDELGCAAVCYACSCMLEDAEFDETEYASGDARFHNSPPTPLPGKPSSAAVELLRLLLKHGLDPNAVSGSASLMEYIANVENGYIGADALALLLEHGGDPCLMHNGESPFDEVDFRVIFDAIEQYNRRRYDALVHCRFVLLGYGAKLKNGTLPVDTFYDFDLSRLKNHRDYDFCLTHVPNRGNN